MPATGNERSCAVRIYEGLETYAKQTLNIFSDVTWSRFAKESDITPVLKKATQVRTEVTTLANEIVQRRVEDLIHGLEKVKQFMNKFRFQPK